MDRLRTFLHAFNGLRIAFIGEANFRFHLAAVLVVTILGLFFQINHNEWFAVLICFAIVITAELINTAIEHLCDLITTEEHPKIKKSKDVAAAAVLVAAITSLAIGVIIFFPYFFKL